MAGRKKAAAPRKKAAPVRKRRDPEVSVKAVGELPQHQTARTTRYARAMAEVRAKVKRGTWASIATFDSPNGAAAVRRAILNGERPIDGQLKEWEIESMRMRDAAGQIIGSELYVKLK